MSKSMNMLRTRRRDNNVKPNRKLDRKSSRGMIYENEELRLKTININAEVERGQSDIKKLKRENEMLKKEMWCLRDAYDKLDKLIKEKELSFSSSSTTCSSSNSEAESCSTCSSESNAALETNQNLENVQKTNLKGLHVEFDHLSVVPEENSTENSDKNSSIHNPDMIIKADQSYPILYDNETQQEQEQQQPKHFFSPIKLSKSCEEFNPTSDQNLTPYYYYDYPLYENLNPMSKSSTDLIVKSDNRNFSQNTMTSSSFSNGGNLEELLNDIESISKDILKLSNGNLSENQEKNTKPFKSELNVVLMPTPMPLLGFDKFRNALESGSSETNLKTKSLENFPILETPSFPIIETPSLPMNENPFCFDYFNRYNPDNYINSGIVEKNENDESDKIKNTNNNVKEEEKVEKPKEKEKLSIRRKVSIHFKGKKATSKIKIPDEKPMTPKITSATPSIETKLKKTPSLDSKKSNFEESPKIDKSPKSNQSIRKSQSLSPEKHVQLKDDKTKHKKHKLKIGGSEKPKSANRRSTISNGGAERFPRERSFSVCTDRSNPAAGGSAYSVYDDYHSEKEQRERTNSLSSCGTVKMRKMSNVSNFPVSGKIPWCGCWGNGCL